MDSITIGRSESCNIRVTGDNTVSGVHCRISRVNNQYVFENLGRNGSSLNGRMLTGPVVIAPDSPVMIGSRTRLPWVEIQRQLPLGGAVATGHRQPGMRGSAGGWPQPKQAPQHQPQYQPQPQTVYEPEYVNHNDTCGFGWWILSFLFPIVGFILYFVWRRGRPNRARRCCLIPAIISVAISVAVNFTYAFIMAL